MTVKDAGITFEADRLLRCFVGGLDDVVYQLAAKLAIQRGNIENGTAFITEDDLREAGKSVLGLLKKVLDDSDDVETNRIIMETIEHAEKCLLHNDCDCD